MPELEEEKKQQVTYERLDTTDTTDPDYSRKLNQYVWESLPLTPQQKLDFRVLYLADTGGDGDSICNSSMDVDGVIA
jgi:hypothetical protein